MTTEHDVRAWADLAMEYPEAAWGLGLFGGIAFLTINLAWWLFELPALINAHDDSRLLVAFAASIGVVVFDTVTGIWAWRAAHRLSAAMHQPRIDHDEKR